MSHKCINGHVSPTRDRWGACIACKRECTRRYKKRKRAAERRLNATKKRGGIGGYWLTDKGRAAIAGGLRGPVVVADCSARCGCGDCVMARLRRRGKLALG